MRQSKAAAKNPQKPKKPHEVILVEQLFVALNRVKNDVDEQAYLDLVAECPDDDYRIGKLTAKTNMDMCEILLREIIGTVLQAYDDEAYGEFLVFKRDPVLDENKLINSWDSVQSAIKSLGISPDDAAALQNSVERLFAKVRRNVGSSNLQTHEKTLSAFGSCAFVSSNILTMLKYDRRYKSIPQPAAPTVEIVMPQIELAGEWITATEARALASKLDIELTLPDISKAASKIPPLFASKPQGGNRRLVEKGSFLNYVANKLKQADQDTDDEEEISRRIAETRRGKRDSDRN